MCYSESVDFCWSFLIAFVILIRELVSLRRYPCLELHLQMMQLLLLDALFFPLPACSFQGLSEVTDAQLGCKRNDFKVF